MKGFKIFQNGDLYLFDEFQVRKSKTHIFSGINLSGVLPLLPFCHKTQPSWFASYTKNERKDNIEFDNEHKILKHLSQLNVKFIPPIYCILSGIKCIPR